MNKNLYNINGIDFNVIRNVASIAQSRICGFILYKTTDAEMVKVMRDPDYLRAMNDLSGDRWPIFAIKPLEPPISRIMGGGNPRGLGLLITQEEDPKVNEPIIDFFGLDKTNDAPCFVLFCWDNDGKLLVTHYKLTTGSVDIAYNSIKEVINEITESEKLILPEYRKGMGVYRQAREAVEHLKSKKRFEKDSEYGSKLLSAISSILTIIYR